MSGRRGCERRGGREQGTGNRDRGTGNGMGRPLGARRWIGGVALAGNTPYGN